MPAIATVIQPALTDVEVETAKDAAERMDGKLVVAFRGKEWKLKGTKIRKWISFAHDANGSVQPVVDSAAIAKALKPVAKGVKRAPHVGRLLQVPRPGHRRRPGEERAPPRRPRDGGGHRRRQSPSAGRAPQPAPVNVKVAQVAPKLTTEEAVKKGPLMTRLGIVEDVVPGQRPQLLRRQHLAAGQDHRRHGAVPRPAVRVVERRRPVSSSTRVRAGRVHRRRPHRADRRPRRRDVLELDDAVQRRDARRPADGRAVESQVLHPPLSARPRRHGVQDAGRWRPDDVVHQRHEAPDRHPHLSATPRAAWAGSGTRSGASPMAGP